MIACLSCLAAPAPLAAGPSGAADLLRMFADCAGRYSAETEHGWLVEPGGSDVLRQRRDQFADLAEAVDGADAQQVMGWRVAAKAAQRGLLSRAHFTGDAAAGRVARAHRTRCDGLLPSG